MLKGDWIVMGIGRVTTSNEYSTIANFITQINWKEEYIVIEMYVFSAEFLLFTSRGEESESPSVFIYILNVSPVI